MHPSRDNRFVGFEFELSRPLMKVVYAERDRCARWNDLAGRLVKAQNSSAIRAGWGLHEDRSCGGEIVSPKMRKSDGAFAEIAHICNMVNGMAMETGLPATDGECGLHIHYDATDITAANLSAIFATLHSVEPIIFSIYTDRNNTFCAPINVDMSLASRMRKWVPDVRDVWYRPENNSKDGNKKYTKQFINSTEAGNRYDGTRYHGFNIHCYWRIGTIEFRYARGTFDLEKIWAFYELCSAIIEHAISRKRIPTIDTSKDFNTMLQETTSNYKFRRNFVNMCKSLQLPKEVIRIFLKMLRTDNSKLLEKDPAKSTRWICESNKSKFIINTQIGAFTTDGRLLPATAVIKSLKHVLSGQLSLTDDKQGVKVIFGKNIVCDVPIVIPEALVTKFKEKPVAAVGSGGIKFIE